MDMKRGVIDSENAEILKINNIKVKTLSQLCIIEFHLGFLCCKSYFIE